MFYLFNSGTKVRPVDFDRMPWGTRGTAAVYVLQKVGAKAATIAMPVHDDEQGYRLGDVHDVEQDQTGRYLGRYRVVGIAYRAGSEITTHGDVPARALTVSVLK